MGEVVTRGSGEIEVVADQAEVRVSFSAHAPSRDAAVAELGARIPTVDAALTSDGVVVRQRSVHVGDRWHGDRVSGSTASLQLVVRFVDLAVLDDVMAALVAARPEQLDGPHWSLRDQTSAVRDAQARALSDARSRAEAYAAALGGRLGALVRIADDGVEQPYPMHGGGGMRMSLAADMGGGQEAVRDLGLTPSPVTARATCVATWELAL